MLRLAYHQIRVAAQLQIAGIVANDIERVGIGIGYNMAVALFGGFAPFVATFRARAIGNNHAPAVYVIMAAIVTLIVLLRTRETAFAPLR